jgi:hypothetical protein
MAEITNIQTIVHPGHQMAGKNIFRLGIRIKTLIRM